MKRLIAIVIVLLTMLGVEQVRAQQMVERLADLRPVSGQSYQLAPTRHVLSATVSLPSDVTIDASNATIEFRGRDWAPIWSVNGRSNITIVGGTYQSGPNQVCFEFNNASNVTVRNVTLGEVGGGFTVRGSRNVTIDGVQASVVNHYGVFAEHHLIRGATETRVPNDGLTIRNFRLTEGSKRESGIRVHATRNLTIENAEIVATLNKRTAIRLHDGENFVVRNSRLVGGVGSGPLAEGDGGREFGLRDWLDARGNWLLDRPTRPANADITRTMAHRQQQLGLRMVGVRFEDCTIEGSLILKAGLSGYEVIRGSIDPGKGPGPMASWRVFEQYTAVYPETPEWRLPGDVLRPRPEGRLVGVTVDQKRLNAPAGISIEARPIPPPVQPPEVLPVTPPLLAARSLGKPVFVSVGPSATAPRGALPIHVEGGGRYWPIPSDPKSERSFFVGGYFGPRVEIDRARLPAAFNVYEPGAHYGFNIEHWPWDTQWSPVADVQTTVRRFVDAISAFRATRPDMRFSIYGLPHSAAFVARGRMPVEGWRAANDAIQPVLDQLDVITPSLYTFMDVKDDPANAAAIERYIDMTIADARARAKGKPVVPYIMAFWHDGMKRDGGLVSIDQFRTEVRRILSQADGVILWNYQPATQSEYLRVVLEEASK